MDRLFWLSSRESSTASRCLFYVEIIPATICGQKGGELMNKAGHNKEHKDGRQPSIECGDLTGQIEIRQPVTKPNGAIGERTIKVHLCLKCL
jgi:hypothetical protein